ncbi:hypothetical protein JRQ81_004320 [Phrynocephalus forsythii]|uniref:Photoreceptor cilium actin regulator n=1 Tax=Phrynocephalus forsythii TaxID=171643 RepID=A0A9Q0Y4T0_9SAUR|nr:hypothetical protein JRQ81_004320 [Phrynocephalus forsythii]
MGCTPSRSDIANHHAQHGVMPAGLEGGGFSLPLLIKSSSSFDTEEFCQEETQVKDNLLGNASDEEKHFSFNSSSEDPSLPELDQDKRESERTVSENEVAITEMVESDKQKEAGSKIKKQDSCASEKNSVTLEDKNESSEKQNPKKGKRQKSNRQGKQGRHLKTKEKLTPPAHVAEKKVDFPDLLVKAHQNAYAYLNPNLSKYEVILCMANQATETQLIMQQMVSFLLFRFDEINHLLEEIAQDGEYLLKEVGGHLAWPAGKGNSKEQPDLLQQLLQYTVNKMQVLNGTVASLTSDALQDSCSFLHSAGSNLEEKLKAKHAFDERLLKIIKLLEASALGPNHAHPEDMTLYSEDSGIGIDSESVKDLNFIDKQGMHTDFDSCPYVHQSLCQMRTSEENQGSCHSTFTTSRSHVCALERQFKDIFYPPAHTKNVKPSSDLIREKRATHPYHQNISKAPSLHSVHCGTTHEDDCFKECESLNVSSASEDSDSRCSEEESDSGSLSAPTDCKQISNKRRESPENEEIILKMKDAISEKIKFVPAKSGKKEWVEEDTGKGSLRPRTAARSQKPHKKEKRSRSEESLRSHGEDPTLLELQRTQKGLSKRLEMFYTLCGEKDTLMSLNLKEPSNLQDSEHVTHRSSTNKLKASLAKNFNILPNQDSVPLFRQDQNAIRQPPDERKGRKCIRMTPSSMDPASRKENEPPETQKLNHVDCVPPRKSVKKLIETFSPMDGLVKPSGLRTLGPIKCVRKFGLPSITPNLLPRGLVPLNHKHRISPLGDINCRDFSLSHCSLGAAGSPIPAREIEGNEDSDEDDMENLPPPPPEMLVDTSPDSNASSEGAEKERKDLGITSNTAKKNECCTSQKSIQISARMKASLCSMDLLPSKNLSGPNLIASKTTKNTDGDATPRKHSFELESAPDCYQESPLASKKDQEMEEATVELHKQSHKIIPLQNLTEMPEENGNNPESKECPAPFAVSKKKSSPDAFRKNEKTTNVFRRVSPSRTPPASPPSERKLPSTSQHRRHFKQASVSTASRQPSPPSNSRVPSPPAERKLPSLPIQQNLSSPPTTRKQQNPPIRRKLSSPQAYHKEASPPPFSTTPSPPTSPSWLHKGLQSKMDSGDEQQPASPKIVSNARSIFYPATASLFEAKPVLPPSSFATEALAYHPEVILTAFARRSSAQLEQCGNQQKRMAYSATNPQPFVRRSSSDRRPGLQIPVPLFAPSGSEPVLTQIR